MKFIVVALFVLAAPAFCALNAVDENSFQKLVASHKGKVVIYDFWATWCDGCRAELPKLVELQAKLRAQGFELVTISADEPEQVAAAEKFLKKNAVPGALYRKQVQDDDRFNSSIDVKWSGALPALFLYDKSGRKVQSFIGVTDMANVERAVRKLL